MGWLFMNSLCGFATPKAYMEAQFTFETDEGTSEILASAVVGMRTWYAACRQLVKKTGKTETFALVCLIRYNPRSKDDHVFGYKDMSEFMGPNEARCPARILDLLGPTTDENALAWRARCRSAIAVRGLAQPKHGDTIIFADALTFTDGSKASRFRVTTAARTTRFINPLTGHSCTISRWRDRAWTIIPAIDLTRTAA
jgi:hypothetical protein